MERTPSNHVSTSTLVGGEGESQSSGYRSATANSPVVTSENTPVTPTTPEPDKDAVLRNIATARAQFDQALDKAAKLAEARQSSERYQAYQLGICYALDEQTKAYMNRARARHLSVQERRIFNREAQNMHAAMAEADGKATVEEAFLQSTAPKLVAAQAGLKDALQAFIDMALVVMDIKPATGVLHAEPLSWKDHEILRLADQVKKLEVEASQKRC
ncbi:hypothetical protein NKR23_g7216 [Pleurostoma richardsiae]|uniref:Uncharacterized protein n=1 Tax=Pleurostoma richardsiae TaxID=41990 RepID=A0AA38RIE7_9PEZI|nr:hypothetical protein NKR23_g7216 [Pleurostoma richardsiae]